uniref:Zinc finger and BTB domain containing 48 n=1 Tax=Nothobranchius pienaari TaxID=704102 RepID=A0A1A8PCW3_9TELE
MAAESSHAQRLLSFLDQQRAVGRFCDAVLNLGDGVLYPAHRNVLACFSELLEQSSASGTPCTEFRLQGCPSDGLELLLGFIYTGELKLEPGNLHKVQQAAVSLCVPEALVLCQQFQGSSVDRAPLKQKRGRPRKCPPDLVKVENSSTAAGDESSFDSTASSSALITTTRSGRVVKGPKWLRPTPESARFPPVEETEVMADVRQAPGEPAAEEREDEGAGDLEGAADDTDEEYFLIAENSPTSVSTLATQKCKTQNKTNDKNVAAAENKDPVACPICNKSFKSKYYLKVHNRRHTGEKPFGCVKCGKRYFRKENLLVHESRDCSRGLTYACSTCSSSFNTKEELRVHVVTHTGQMPHQCLMCNEQFMYKKKLTTHMMKVHGHPKPHGCPQCPKTFLTRTELRVHEAAKHRGEKPFVCEECGHRASSRNGLQMHIKAIHRNERPFVCTTCGHAFSQKNNLNLHLRVHSGERPYQCHLCGKTFRTQGSLDKHQRTHTGERPYGCDVCEQRFTEKGALLRHKASRHEEGRPHSCYVCTKTFKAKEQLRVHLRRHKGMRKFECGDCGYMFTRQAHLRRHCLIHKRTDNYKPQQRKLRSIIVQNVDDSPDESQVTKSVDAQKVGDDSPESPVVPESPVIPGSSDPQSDSATGLVPLARVLNESGDTAMNDEVSRDSLEQDKTEELQRSQLVSETYESTVDMDGVEDSSKT